MIARRSLPVGLGRFVLLSLPLILLLPLAAEAGNNATVLEQSSSVPASAGSGATVAVMVRVQNTGDSVWRSGNLHRLGASSQNQVSWSGYRCGGYMSNPTDGRVFLCHDVAPGQTHDFQFNVTVPSSGSARLSVRMVQDGVEWFGETQTWTISVGGGSNLPDVVVTSQRVEPSSPQAGQSVRFVSVVRNQGNATTPSGTVIGVGYFIDNRWVSYGYSSNPLAPGSSVTITTQGDLWRATSGGHTFTAVVDDVNRFPESNESNNSRSMSFTVGSGSSCPTNPVSTPSDRWKLEVFNNRGLSGSPVEIRTDAVGSGGFTFNWGSGRASNCTGNDDFSVRFSRRIYIGTSGTYKFTTRTDDGVRLYVDGQLLIDRWIDQAPTSYSANKSLSAGWHDVRMDYYEHGGGAYAAIGWERVGGGCPTNPVSTPSDRWKLEVFNNRGLSGSPVEIRTDAVGSGGFTFNWGSGRASNCTGNDDFSVRFSRRIYIDTSGTYKFTTRTDDGVRLYVDGQLLIDRWIDQAPTSYSANKSLSAGWHDLRMDYYEHGGGAYAAIGWERVGGGCPTNPVSTPSDRWKLEVFNNRGLSGSPVEIRTDAVGSGGFTFDWGSGRASSCTGNDDFSVRFSRRIYIDNTGTYKFTTRTDDGVRLYVDGQLLIDHWIDQAPTSYSANKSLSAGWHDLRMDYYEHGGGAYAAIGWERQSSGGGEGNLYGMNIDPANGYGDPSAQDLKNIGARWVRIEYKTHKGLAFYDSKIAKYRNAGIKVLLIVDYASVPGKPSGSGTDSQWASYLNTFNSGLRSIASHFRNNVDAWQIWNEPDLSPQQGYDVYVPAKHFGAMLRDSVTAIREVSSRPVVTGGLASGNPNYLSEARSAAGGLTVDAVAVHPYGQRAPDNWPNPNWGFGNMSTLFDRYLAFGKPLWVTEIGVNTSDEGFQADYLENVYVLARDRYRDRVQVVFWFCWSDGMVPPFGILRSNGEQKPAYHQYRAVAPPY